VVLLGALAACTTRAPHHDFAAAPEPLPEPTVMRLLSVWQRQLSEYITHEGLIDPGMLSQTRALRSRDTLRPARILFGVLDVEASNPGRDGWDVQGLLVSKHVSSAQSWYVFVVGLVKRAGYRPSSIQDIRLAAFAVQGGKLGWAVSGSDPPAVQRYRDTFGAAPIRFPGDSDRFRLTASGASVSVSEARSGARWSLPLGDRSATPRVDREQKIDSNGNP